MRKFSTLGLCLLAALFALYRPVPALAQAVTGTCGVVLASDCFSPDTTFIPTAARVSVSAGVTTVQCVGTTTTLPATATKCDGERVNGKTGDTAPTHPCSITLGSTSAHVDDWYETISTSGSVTLVCSAGGTDPK
jgi:hypothetical protein